MPIGHWYSSSKTGTPTIFGVVLFEQLPIRRYFYLRNINIHRPNVHRQDRWNTEKGIPDGFFLTSNINKI